MECEMEDASRRVELVSEINGSIANIATARARANAAETLLAGAEKAHFDLRRRYTELRADVKSRDLLASERLQKARDLNECLAQIAETEKTLNKAKSERGTAAAELKRLESQLETLEQHLDKVLPTNLLVGADAFAL